MVQQFKKIALLFGFAFCCLDDWTMGQQPNQQQQHKTHPCTYTIVPKKQSHRGLRRMISVLKLVKAMIVLGFLSKW